MLPHRKVTRLEREERTDFTMNNSLDALHLGEGAGYIDGRERAASRRRRRNAVRASSICHIGLIVYTLVAAAVIAAIEFGLMAVFGQSKAIEIVSNPYVLWGLQVLAMYVIAFPIFLLITSTLPKRRAEKSGMSLGEFVTLFIIAQGIMVAGSIVSNLLAKYIGNTTGTEMEDMTSALISASPLWLVVLVVVIIGPIIEELIFRKVFIDRLSIYGDRLAIAVSSVAFGLIHGNIYQLLYATAVGFLLGYVYTKTRRIRYSCMLHILINFMGTVPSLLIQPGLERIEALSEQYATGNIPVADTYIAMFDVINMYSFLLIQYGLAIAGIVLLIVLTVKRAYKFPNSCEYRLPGKTVARVAFFNLGAIIFFLFIGSEILLSMFPDIPYILLEALMAKLPS